MSGFNTYYRYDESPVPRASRRGGSDFEASELGFVPGAALGVALASIGTRLMN